jgi:hypothetical protein
MHRNTDSSFLNCFLNSVICFFVFLPSKSPYFCLVVLSIGVYRTMQLVSLMATTLEIKSIKFIEMLVLELNA